MHGLVANSTTPWSATAVSQKHCSMKRQLFFGSVLCALCCSLANLRSQTTLYVDLGRGSDSNSGTSATRPLQNLRRALSIASSKASIREIRVTSGVHTPGSSRSSTFRLRSNLAIKGGYRPGFLLRSSIFPTVLSGEIGRASTRSDNCRTVVTAVGVRGARLDRVLIRHGYGGSTLSGSSGNGAGLLVSSSSLLVNECQFYENFATNNGGAIDTRFETSLTILASSFVRNRSGLSGGAVNASVNSNTNASVVIDRCRFFGNTSIRAGALDMESGKISVYNSIFSGNAAEPALSTARGGAIYCSGGRNPKLVVNCSFTGNR